MTTTTTIKYEEEFSIPNNPHQSKHDQILLPPDFYSLPIKVLAPPLHYFLKRDIEALKKVLKNLKHKMIQFSNLKNFLSAACVFPRIDNSWQSLPQVKNV